MSSSSVNKTKQDHSGCVCPPLDTSICFVEGSRSDKLNSYTTQEMIGTVWRHIKPPIHFGTNQPLVSARKIDVTRAHLTGRLAPKRPEPPPVHTKFPCMRKTAHEDDD